jgi:integrase
VLTFRTLKQWRDNVYRTVPVSDILLDTMELVHGLKKALRGKRGQGDLLLWPWGRTQAYKHIKALMDTAGIQGPHASPKGLRHGFGVRAANKTRQPRAVQKWLGHRDLNTTAIYMDVQGEEERELAARLWE